MSGTREPVALINLTGKDIYANVNGTPTLLPAGPRPTVLDCGGTSPDEITIQVAGGTTTLKVSRPGPGSATLGVPPVLDGVLYLVQPEVAAAFPHRDDFMCPSAYRYLPGGWKTHTRPLGTLWSVRRGVLTAAEDAEDLTTAIFDL